MSNTTTRGVRIQIESRYLPEHSDQDKQVWVFAYTVTISNEGEVPVRLLERHWVIQDGWGEIQEVRGPGVVGKQPYIRPGEAFEYTSVCPLPTPTGSMHGSYQMLDDNHDVFDAEIGVFQLKEPGLH